MEYENYKKEKIMKTTTKNGRTVLTVLMVLCTTFVLLAMFARPASAAVIAGTTGSGTADDPIVVDTFDELNQAMRSTVNYIELTGNATINLPAQGGTL
jgi:hypothetical protein